MLSIAVNDTDANGDRKDIYDFNSVLFICPTIAIDSTINFLSTLDDSSLDSGAIGHSFIRVELLVQIFAAEVIL